MQSSTDALAYLASVNEPIRPVTVARLTKLGWRWYAPAAMQLLTDEDLLTYAQNHRELV